MPVLATFFSVRRGRDPFFKFFMKTIFPRQVREYEEKFGIRLPNDLPRPETVGEVIELFERIKPATVDE